MFLTRNYWAGAGSAGAASPAGASAAGASGAGASAAGASMAGASAGASIAGASAGAAASSFWPQAVIEAASRAARRTEYFILISLYLYIRR
ncbi:hypothetical protein Tbd_0767 [Thiobacillus denitrificans ATCC 25259]|uniref:Uncharacterized protein n=1 Tax=Thiobacillus denitrificans (strain ATCC 25259 / T1) TaxID=292415 RepID=Q3SKQ5_THIDA|nr:hypothetical protein Tbd_0767 [Thiobacillus denitrificans ATCC 25259]